MSGPVAVLNAGSSSIKFAVYGHEDALLFRGQVEKIGAAPHLKVKDAAGADLRDLNWPAERNGHRRATEVILQTAVDLLGGERVFGVGHRVVHGGLLFSEPVRVDTAVLDQMASLSRLAPLHQPHNVAAIRAIVAAAPHLPQVACFDTAFHRTQPEIAQLYALPRSLTASGIRRYGFHGLSYEYVSGRLRTVAPSLAAGRTIVAHLGNGASLCALENGTSQASTMGFTAVDGLMMGTRCGSLDPGVLLYLMDQRGMQAREIEDLLYRQSGLLGVSGVSSDMRDLLASAEPSAILAVDLFIYRIVREMGSMAAALGGVDGIVFTGGIGENDAQLRRRVIQGCRWLGAQLGENDQAVEGKISSEEAPVEVWVIPTDEEKRIAHHTRTVLSQAAVA